MGNLASWWCWYPRLMLRPRGMLQFGMSAAWTGEMSFHPFPAPMEVGQIWWPLSAALGSSRRRQQMDLDSIGTWGEKGEQPGQRLVLPKLGYLQAGRFQGAEQGWGFAGWTALG